MAHQKVETWQHAEEILQMEIQRQNRKTLRTTGKVPIEVWEIRHGSIDGFAGRLFIRPRGNRAVSRGGLADQRGAAAYRRDRRKDALLHENGCHVLRFLAEDLSKRLDPTLDAILHAVAHLRRKRQ